MIVGELIEKNSIRDFFQWAHREGVLLDAQDTGSRVICDPPVLDTDDDKLLLVKDLEHAGNWFSCNGWDNCFEDWKDKADKDPAEQVDTYTVELADGARFQSWRRGTVNVIVTDDEVLHLRSRAATLLAKELNLTDKKDRIRLFRAVKFAENYGGRYQ